MRLIACSTEGELRSSSDQPGHFALYRAWLDFRMAAADIDGMLVPPQMEDRFSSWLDLIEAALDRALPAGSPQVADLHAAMRYGVFPGGKRIRPLLVLAVTDALSGDVQHALPSATALELLHCYTLIHDDLPCMDNDIVRRGRPTCHVQFGAATALLAGDALLTLAMEQAAIGVHAPAAVVRLLAEAAGAKGVIAGQAADLAAVGRVDVTAEDLAYIHANKTAALFRCAAVMGVYAAGKGTDPVLLKTLACFGFSLGLAFQYTDDLLDADTETAFSSLGVLGLEEVRKRARRFTAEALREIDGLGDAGEPLRVLAQCMLEREA